MVTPLAMVNAPPVNNAGLELLVVVVASPIMIAVAAKPNGPLVFTATSAPAINVPSLMLVVPV